MMEYEFYSITMQFLAQPRTDKTEQLIVFFPINVALTTTSPSQ